MAVQTQGGFLITVRMKVCEFAMPPVRDALVLGKDSPIGCQAMRRALAILQPAPYEHIELNPADDVISDILVRASVLKKVPREKLAELVLARCKPVMQPDECLHLDISAELYSEDQI